jgi:predicted nucleotidyltransferase
VRTLSITAEYNPFHSGHRYAVEELKKRTGADTVLSVMSGNFTQRGIPAFQDKWTRAEAAVRGGVDLVLEMPAVYASAASPGFCMAGVSIAAQLGCTDYIGFGSESGSIQELTEAAENLIRLEKPLHERIAMYRKQGFSYPRAQQQAALDLGVAGGGSVLSEPNNLLAVEYMRQILQLPGDIRPAAVTVRRESGDYHVSASAVRRKAYQEDPQYYQQCEDRYFRLAAARILQMSEREMENIASSSDGLGNKLKKEIRYCGSLQDLLERVKSKAYTMTRVQRMLTQCILGVTGEDMRNCRLYARVLAFSAQGAKLLKHIRKSECSRIPVITNLNKEAHRYPEIRRSLEIDVLAADLYHLITGEDLYERADYVRHPAYVRKNIE